MNTTERSITVGVVNSSFSPTATIFNATRAISAINTTNAALITTTEEKILLEKQTDKWEDIALRSVLTMIIIATVIGIVALIYKLCARSMTGRTEHAISDGKGPFQEVHISDQCSCGALKNFRQDHEIFLTDQSGKCICTTSFLEGGVLSNVRNKRSPQDHILHLTKKEAKYLFTDKKLKCCREECTSFEYVPSIDCDSDCEDTETAIGEEETNYVLVTYQKGKDVPNY